MHTFTDHLYTVHSIAEIARIAGYTSEGTACLALSEPRPELFSVPVYRYSRRSGPNFYTTNQDEGNYLASHKGFCLEDDGRPVWHVFSRQCACCGTIPLYRWYNPEKGDYFYTVDPTGERVGVMGYVMQGLLGYVFPRDAPVVGCRKPLYRWSKRAPGMR
ncbi:hypothetical protein CTheo_6335 [Ceratobasidium theobromae]|uniref:DUF5648 domain-containing protein n=1 Tax=Ceratobasidium theobromae TaxID=1582974 RepID=A0A5N5QEQ2_9AGAM|nr:hypothetical protein CTheo_6335 [Ceratobasidium theobromae]